MQKKALSSLLGTSKRGINRGLYVIPRANFHSSRPANVEVSPFLYIK